MWNYRVVRKKTTHFDSDDKKERAYYSYAIHEAYYDNNGKAGSITEESVNPFGENVEELRHSWVMMAEAFGQPILDYDKIPEPGYDIKENAIGTTLKERTDKIENGDEELIPWEDVKDELEKKHGPFDHDKYEKEVEIERIEKEEIHKNSFVGVAPLEKLIETLRLDYKERRKRDREENPWNYEENDADS